MYTSLHVYLNRIDFDSRDCQALESVQKLAVKFEKGQRQVKYEAALQRLQIKFSSLLHLTVNFEGKREKALSHTHARSYPP